jgi:hypothetical protein
MQIADGQPWTVDNEAEFTDCPTIDQLLDLQKQREKEDAEEPSSRKLVILAAD